MENPLDGPILDPDHLPYGIRLGPMPPGASGSLLWVNGQYLGFVPNGDQTWTLLKDRLERRGIGGPTDDTP